MAYGAKPAGRASDIPVEDQPTEDLTEEQLLQRFKEWLRLSSDAEAKQRDREREDLRFQVAENQWPAEALQERKGRPMLSISLLHQPMQLVQNQAASARLGVTLSAVNEKASDEVAEIKQGLYQRIQRDGLADQARLWALDRAKQCGRGWYRINTQYDEDSENPSDQEIVYERILYQEMVFPDPSATKPDFSDGRFCFLAAYIPCEEFHKRWPNAEKYTSSDFAELQSSEPEWVRAGTRDPMVAELFYKETTYVDVGIDAEDGRYERKREEVKICRVVLSGHEILEKTEWPGKYIPVIPVIGRELQPVDGERRWEGMVRPARDGQRTFNYAISSLVEDIGRLSKAPYVGVEGQFEGHEDEWNRINRTNQPYVEYKNVDLGGKPAPPPSPMQIDGTKMQLSLQLAQEAKSLVQVATAVYEPSLGEMQKGAKGQSGRAIQALQQQADAGTGNYLGNLAAISIPYEARVVLDLMTHIYDRPGRVTQVLGGEDESKTVMLNAPYVNNPETGQPMALARRPPGAQPMQGAKEYNLAEGAGKYAVAVSVGKSFQTRLEQGATEMGDILTNAPDLMPVLGDLYFKFRDFPGAKEISERLAKWREKQFPGLGEDKDGQPDPVALQAQVQALQQQLQEAQGQLQAASQYIQTEQAKQQAALQKAQIDAQAKVETAAQKGALDEALAKFQAAHETALEQTKNQFEQVLQDQKLEFERWKVQFEAAHEVGMAAAGGTTRKVTRDEGQEQGQESERESSSGQSRQPKQEGED